MISCSQYDYIELVCMYKYPVALTLKSGEMVSGKALDTARNERREECIKLLDSKSKHKQLVVLDNVKTLKVTINNPHLSEVSFE